MEKMGLKSIKTNIPKKINIKQEKPRNDISIFERHFQDKKNYLNSYYSDWAHGRRTEFIEKRIPTPITGKRMNYKKMKRLFMDKDLGKAFINSNSNHIFVDDSKWVHHKDPKSPHFKPQTVKGKMKQVSISLMDFLRH